jgi:Trk K+ transport system NAD-binding subunit
MEQPVIVCGLGQVGWRVLDYLRLAGLPVVAIDTSCQPDDARLKDVRLIRGDCRQREVLEQAGVAGARGILILTSNDLVNISTALMARHLSAEIRIVVRLFNQNLIARLGKTVSQTIALSVSRLTAPLLAATALTGQALGTFNLEDGHYQVVELIIGPNSALREQTIAGTAAKHRVVVLAHWSASAPERLLLDVDPETRLVADDHLVVCGRPQDLGLLLAEVSDEVLPHLLWAGKIRRMGRVLWRTLTEIDLPVKVCTGVLFGVVASSTLLFWAWGKPLPEGLYRTISIMATGADMDRRGDLDAMQKVFVSILRIAGAALIAAFTAIVTNYLLRARLSGALEVRRIPDSGHVIVCGLGNLGFRVVEELLQCGERVVVIEMQRDGRFMAAARRLGAAVIIGDATVLEVLRQAHAATARAVVSATQNELVNLEVALLARELNPHQRVVVRLLDSQLAQTLRDEANIRLAVSIPMLAAPAFVAALYGDRVQSVFFVKGRLMAVVEIMVRQRSALLGQNVRALAVDYRLLPVSLIGSDRFPRPQPMQQRLADGDCLTVIATLTDLERMLRRDPVPADCSVDVTGFTLLARPLVLQLVREHQGLNPEAADAALEQLPLRVGSRLTRGQAEDLLCKLRHEGVKAQLGSSDPVIAKQ